MAARVVGTPEWPYRVVRHPRIAWQYVCYVFVWYVVRWGNSLSFVLTVYSFGFRYLFIEGEGAGAVAAHHAHTLVSAFTRFLWDLYSDISIGCMIWLLDMVYVVMWFDQTMFLIINVF